VVKIR